MLHPIKVGSINLAKLIYRTLLYCRSTRNGIIKPHDIVWERNDIFT